MAAGPGRDVTSPAEVAAFHAAFEQHPGDRVALFAALAELLPAESRVLYPGSYVDIAPSVWFDDVTYLDLDRRAARFFTQRDAVADLVRAKRRAARAGGAAEPAITFLHHDYRSGLPLPERSMDVLLSLYAGFISEHCTRYLRIGGSLLVNPSHGDAAMASIDRRYRLSAVVKHGAGGYTISADQLDTYLVPRQPRALSVEALHRWGKGIGYTRSAFAYIFTRVA